MLYFIIKVIILLICFFLIVMIVDGNRFVVREYTVTAEKITEDMDIVLLADLHNKQYGKNNSKLVEAIDKIHPDCIIVAGDMVTAKPGKSNEIPIKLFDKLSKYQIFYGIGNHEYRMKIYEDIYGDAYKQYIEQLKKYSVHILENDSIELKKRNVVIQGIMIKREYYKRIHKKQMDPSYLKKLTGNINNDQFQIFIAHNPEYFEDYVNAGADLVLSGHIHGGIMRLPGLGGVISPKCTLFPKYDGGMFKYGKGNMILSRGLGMHTIPIRIFNPGELVVIHLKTCK